MNNSQVIKGTEEFNNNHSLSFTRKVYHTDITVAKQAIQEIEVCLERTESLKDWFIKIVQQPQLR